MKRKSLFILGIFSIALVFAFTACGNDITNDDPATLNLTALNTVIAEAELAKEGVRISYTGADVPVGMKWVTDPVMQNFVAAIERAKAARNAATQTEVDLAKIGLSAAIDAFNAAKQDGSKNKDFTQTELTVLINEANTAKTGVKVSVDGKDVGSQEYWVPQSIMTELDNAISAANSASAGNLDNAFNSLVTALTAFRENKKLGFQPRTITINGLDVPDGTTINLGLFETDQINVNGRPEIGGNQTTPTIQNKTVTVTLYNTSNGTLWTGSGSYYVGFQINTNPSSRIYISRLKVSFSDTNASQTISFISFKPYVFKYTLGEFLDMLGMSANFPSSDITLDALYQQLMKMNYDDAYKQAGYTTSPLFKDENLIVAFNGSDRVNANTPIYTPYNFIGNNNGGNNNGNDGGNNASLE
jgi:hypothetical protein